MTTTEERIAYLDQITKDLIKERTLTKEYWHFLMHNTDPRKTRKDLQIKRLLRAVWKQEDNILNVLNMFNVKMPHDDTLQPFQTLMDSLPRNKLYQLYLIDLDVKTLRPGVIEDFLQQHKKMNTCLARIKKLSFAKQLK
jgi:hypothetical protein